MRSTLPILLRDKYDSLSPQKPKKQGGIFQLHLEQRKLSEFNQTISGFYKASEQIQYKTLRVNRYQAPKIRRQKHNFNITSRSYSLDRNPQNSSYLNKTQQVQNINGLIKDRRQELVNLQIKMTPLQFVANQYRVDLKKIKDKIIEQINHIQLEGFQQITRLRKQVSELRRETWKQCKKNKLDTESLQEEWQMYKSIIVQTQPKIQYISRTL